MMCLGNAWQPMLDVHTVYEREVQECRASFRNVSWPYDILSSARFNCPKCHSDLVAQEDVSNSDHYSANAVCRCCGSKISAEKAIEHALAVDLELEVHMAVKDGAEAPLATCPECGLETYLCYDEEQGCAWCEFVLDDECARCYTSLTPSNASVDNPRFCSYCDNLMSKDD
jgi:hypothetical protein